MTQPIIDVTDPATAGSAQNYAGLPRPYRVTCVEKSTAPGDEQGQDWHRYVLESGRSTIVGQRRGSPETVLAYATACVERLNARGQANGGWNPRGKKPAPIQT